MQADGRESECCEENIEYKESLQTHQRFLSKKCLYSKESRSASFDIVSRESSDISKVKTVS